jgi:hypothetical protein
VVYGRIAATLDHGLGENKSRTNGTNSNLSCQVGKTGLAALILVVGCSKTKKPLAYRQRLCLFCRPGRTILEPIFY